MLTADTCLNIAPWLVVGLGIECDCGLGWRAYERLGEVVISHEGLVLHHGP
jgi:hypothetical protein